MTAAHVFDNWPERYDAWFETPVGRRVWQYERNLLLDFLRPVPGERILDAGCGTGIFARDLAVRGANVTGIDISLSMLQSMLCKARGKWPGASVQAVVADMRRLPFPDGMFDKTVSVTAVEFIREAHRAVGEQFRVTRPGGSIVVATLNRLSPWADRRQREARRRRDSLFREAVFRSPEELLALSPVPGRVATAVHFSKDADPADIPRIEEAGRAGLSGTGAFVTAAWVKPAGGDAPPLR